MKRVTIAVLLSLLVTGCVGLTLAQQIADDYSYEISSQGSLYSSGNVSYIVVQATAEAYVRIHGPRQVNGPIEILFEWKWSPNAEKPVYVWKIILPRTSEEKVKIVESTVAEARASGMDWMPDSLGGLPE